MFTVYDVFKNHRGKTMKLTEIPVFLFMLYELLKIAFYVSIPILLFLILREVRISNDARNKVD